MIAAITPIAIVTATVIVATTAPNDNQQDNDPTTIVPAKTRITHTGDLLRVVNRLIGYTLLYAHCSYGFRPF